MKPPSWGLILNVLWQEATGLCCLYCQGLHIVVSLVSVRRTPSLGDNPLNQTPSDRLQSSRETSSIVTHRPRRRPSSAGPGPRCWRPGTARVGPSWRWRSAGPPRCWPTFAGGCSADSASAGSEPSGSYWPPPCRSRTGGEFWVSPLRGRTISHRRLLKKAEAQKTSAAG